MTLTSWHASAERDVLPTIEPCTGEVRVPLALYNLDQAQGAVPLVLSRREAERLRDTLAALLSRPLLGVPA